MVKGIGGMKVWMKYLIIGWSIVCVAMVIVSFQLMKSQFIKEDYFITATLKEPVKGTLNDGNEWIQTGEVLFGYGDAFDNIAITKKEFVDRMKKAKGIEIENQKARLTILYTWCYPYMSSLSGQYRFWYFL